MVGFFCILQFLRIHKNSNFQIFSILTVSLPTFPHIFSEILSASGRKHIILHVSSRVVYLGTKNVHERILFGCSVLIKSTPLYVQERYARNWDSLSHTCMVSCRATLGRQSTKPKRHARVISLSYTSKTRMQHNNCFVFS